MSYWQEGLLVLGMMAVTFGVRYPMLSLSGRIKMPRMLERALGFVPVAVLSAIAVPIMLAPDGELAVTLNNEYLVAGIASIMIIMLSRHLLLTIILGLSVFLILRFLF